MAILQVNVRPAVQFYDAANSQRREQTAATMHHEDRQINNLSTHRLTSNATDHSANSSTPGVVLPAIYEPMTQDSLPQRASVWQKVVWRLMPATTIGRALISARERLDEAGCDTASLDAQVILAHVLEVERSWLFAHYEYKLNAEQATAFTELIARRMNHEPVAYLVGRKEFYGLEFCVDPRVLIPRPETELLVDAVLDYFSEDENNEIAIADVGTGSGAIALAIAHHAPHARLFAIDLSHEALAVAAHNVELLDTRGQVTLLQGDLLSPLPGPVNAIVANLPYISSNVYPELVVDVRDFEPQLALEAGPDGLDAITKLLQQVGRYLRPEGVIFLEIGYDQGRAVKELAHRLLPNARHISVRQDYHGHDRLVTIVP